VLDPVLKSGRWRHAHNDYAEFFTEWGFPGVSMFVLMLVFPGRRWLGTVRLALADKHHQALSFHRRAGQICFSVAIVSVLIHAMVDFPLQIDAIRHLFAVVVGMVLAMTSSSGRRSARRDMKT